MSLGRSYWQHELKDTISGDITVFSNGLDAFDDPNFSIITRNGSSSKIAWFSQYKDNAFWLMKDTDTNPNYTASFFMGPGNVGIGMSEVGGGGEPGNGVSVIAYGSGTGDEYIGITTKGVDNSTAAVGQFLQLQDVLTGEVEFATIDLSGYLEISDTAAMLTNHPSTAGYGILKNTKTIRADTTSPNGLATRLFAKTLPTSILNGQVAYSNGSNLVGSSNFVWDNPNRRIGLGTTPTVDIDILTSTNTSVGMQLINSNGGNNSYSYILFRASANAGRLAVIGKMGDGVPSAQTRNAGDFYMYNGANFGDIVLHDDYPSGKIRFTAGAGATTQMTLHSTGNLLLGTTTDVPTSILTARSTTKSSSPFPLHTLAESDAITGVQGNFDYETTQNGLRGHNGARKFYLPESTFARGTATRIPFFDANGQIVDDAGMTWDNTNKGLSIISAATAQGRGVIVRQTNSGIQAAAIQFEKIRGSSAVTNGDIIGAFTLRGWSGTQYVTDNALFGGLVTGTVTSSSVPTSIFFNAGSTTGNYNTQLLLHSGGNVGVGNFGSILSGVSAPSEKLHVKGGIFADDGNIYISSSVNTDRNIYVNNSSNNTNSVAVLTAWAGGGSTSSTERYLTLRAFAPNYTNSAYGGSFIAGNYLIGALNFGASASAINQRLHIALGTVSSTTDTVETVYNRFSGANSISNTTRFAAISNRGFQIPGTTTADRVLSKTNQYWISYNTDSTAFNYRDNTGWHLFSTRAYARSMKDGNGIISALPLGDVTIVKTSTPSYLNLKNAGIRLKDSNAKTTHTLLAGVGYGFYAAHKTGGAGNLGGAYSFIDTLGKDFEFYMVQDDASVQQNTGTGPQIVNYLVHPSLPVTGSAWSYGVRIDTTVSIPTVRHMYGNRNADVTRPGTHKFLAGLRGDETLSGFDFRSFGTDGKIAFNVNSALNIRQGGKVYLAPDSTLQFDPSTDLLRLSQYGTGTKEATDLSKTQSNYIAGFATDGTVLDLERKRDTTIYTTDADYNFSAALTTAQINTRYNRIIIFMTCSSSASDHNTLTMHTPDSNLAQCEIVVYSIDDNPTYRNDITFGASNLLSPTGSLNTTYNLSGGQWLHVRVADVSGYKYFISY